MVYEDFEKRIKDDIPSAMKDEYGEWIVVEKKIDGRYKVKKELPDGSTLIKYYYSDGNVEVMKSIGEN